MKACRAPAIMDSCSQKCRLDAPEQEWYAVPYYSILYLLLFYFLSLFLVFSFCFPFSTLCFRFLFPLSFCFSLLRITASKKCTIFLLTLQRTIACITRWHRNARFRVLRLALQSATADRRSKPLAKSSIIPSITPFLVYINPISHRLLGRRYTQPESHTVASLRELILD